MSIGETTSRLISEIVAACKKYGDKNIVTLWGVPRTGKTFVSLAAAQEVAGHELLVQSVQFHPGYTYEDFVEGLRPTSDGGFQAEPGIFRAWNDKALADPANTYVLLIEELSRANIPSVLGEILTFIEYRDRSFVLPVTRDRMNIAPNLVMLATMNPRDRSALELDDAIISRLRIIKVSPDLAYLKEMLVASLPNGGVGEVEERMVSGLEGLFIACRKQFPDTYVDEMPFGHGLFAGVRVEDDLRDLWVQQMLPLLRRPNVPPHPFFDVISENYPWKAAGA